jgi:purine-binding chemotaxis protein CheW
MGRTAAQARRSQYLTFRIADEEYAIPLLAVREIIRYERATKVPQTPPWIHGVVNLRGAVVAVVDLAVKFGLAPAALTRSTCIVVTEVATDEGQVVLGVLTDAVDEVVELADDEIQPAPAFGTRVRTEFLRGVGCVPSGLVMVLDSDAALSRDEVIAAEKVAAEPPVLPIQPPDGATEREAAAG